MDESTRLINAIYRAQDEVFSYADACSVVLFAKGGGLAVQVTTLVNATRRRYDFEFPYDSTYEDVIEIMQNTVYGTL